MSNPKKEAPQCAHPAKQLKVWRPNDGFFYDDGRERRLAKIELDLHGNLISEKVLPTLFLCPSCGIAMKAGSEQLKRAVKRDLEALAT